MRGLPRCRAVGRSDARTAANITKDSTTGIGRWSRDQFVELLRTGKRPDGTEVNPFMPWSTYRHLNDQEMDALWAYLQTRPAQPFGNR